MATKQKSELNNPNGAKDLSTVNATSRVAKEPSTSFDERTQVTKPFINKDGEQVNGSADVPSPTDADLQPQIVSPEMQAIEEQQAREAEEAAEKERKAKAAEAKKKAAEKKKKADEAAKKKAEADAKKQANADKNKKKEEK